MSILTPEQIRIIRKKQQWTQEELATVLGYTGVDRRQLVSRLERGTDEIDIVRANLMLAIDRGYQPVDENGVAVIEPAAQLIATADSPSRRYKADPLDLTDFQASALNAALHQRGQRFFTSKNRATAVALQRVGLLSGHEITEAGRVALDWYRQSHPKVRFR